MPESLSNSFLSSLRWTAFDRIAVQCITFAVQLVLARLLLPADFGIVGTVAIILAIASAITDGGLGAAIVQNPDINRADLSTIFVINIFVSLLLLGVILMASPTVAAFYNEPVLETLLPMLAVSTVILSVGQTQMAMLKKNMEFKRLFKISIPATIIGGITGIGMALLGMGVWSLAWQRLTRSLVQSASIWTFCNPNWRPQFSFEYSSLKKVIGFSSAKLATTTLLAVAKNMHGLVIGKAFGMDDLGIYNRAQAFQAQPVNALQSSINRVAFPVFSKIQDDNSRIRRALKTSVPLLAFVVAPAMFWLMTVAKPLLILLITEKWVDSVPLLQVCPLLGIFFAIASVKMNIINGKGLVKKLLVMDLIKHTLQLAVLLITCQYSIFAMLVGQVACALVNSFINDFFVSKEIGYSMSKMLFDWLPYALVAATAMAVASLLNFANELSNVLLILLQSSVFATVYLLTCWMAGLQAFQDLTKKFNLESVIGIRVSRDG